jgi:3-deoxy-D-manno-octulosonate 8-phosphate phosphatase (KDO 8-P phosphatase)
MIPKKPKLIVYDFDGVMTNNQILISEDGTEGVVVNRGDGWGVEQLQKAGFQQIILSTEKNPVVSARAKKLKILALQGCSDKKNQLAKYCKKNKIRLSNVVYVGNDVNDLAAMKIVGFVIAPADSHRSVLKIANYVTNAQGGSGVVREISDLILRKERF